ncbi:hypothetical protein CYMTET_14515 [Cymbomonas tetramitiformis]|uniref:Uncharacterized protein n=1 Tax=Cymbomonas tetramitiformis TaxID=36881 RepID=A0AAE0GG82_9CHLO|nr:hypothetical protein CYMTET_14515 [Cymbomonas tetramitiformis]
MREVDVLGVGVVVGSYAWWRFQGVELVGGLCVVEALGLGLWEGCVGLWEELCVVGALGLGCGRAVRGKVDIKNSRKHSAGKSHDIINEECMVCTMCKACTGYGNSCCNHEENRTGGEMCGCGGGNSGCKDCGMCEGCTEMLPECLVQGNGFLGCTAYCDDSE